MKVLILASGRGSNFEAILKASKKSSLPVKVAGLLCDRDCNAMNIARLSDVPVSVIKPKDYETKQQHTQALISAVTSYDPDYILLAGYMRIIPSELIDLYPLRIVNIHPSLLPNFKGKDGIKQAWDAGVKTTGVTVHFVNDRMDDGLIIAQEKIPVPGSIEDLENKIHEVEHRLYVEAVRMLAEDFKYAVVSRCLLGNKYSKRAETFVKNFKGKVFSVKEFVDKMPKDGKVLAVLKDPQGLLTKELTKTLANNIFILSEDDL